jgi:hypothetical protein
MNGDSRSLFAFESENSQKAFSKREFSTTVQEGSSPPPKISARISPSLETDDVGSFGGRECFLMLADFRSSQRSVRETGEVIISFRKELGKDRRIGLTPLFRGGTLL